MIARRDPEDALKVAAAAVALRARVGGVFPPVYRERLDSARAVFEVSKLAAGDLTGAPQPA